MAVWLDKAITCRDDTWNCNPYEGPCYCGDEGTLCETFNVEDTVFAYTEFKASGGYDFYGKHVRHEWWYKGELKWEYEWTVQYHYIDYWCCWTWWAIGLNYGPGAGFIKTFFEGEYIGSTNDFIIPGQGAIHEILREQSTFHTGPFNPNWQVVAEVTSTNIGDMVGLCWMSLYEYPNTPQERLLNGPFGYEIEPGGLQDWTWYALIPDEPGGIYPLGIKAWSDHEDEPSWSLKNKILLLER